MIVDPQFADAKAGLLHALGFQLFLSNGDQEIMQPIISRMGPVMSALRMNEQDNPRMIWVLGQSEWRTPPTWTRDRVLERQEGVIAGYRRGLDLQRAQREAARGDLDPRWGEPELLMSIAWAQLNKAAPDLAAAERAAREALALVPHWHYVRDILLPQILKAKGQ
jgi:hypothetical protein